MFTQKSEVNLGPFGVKWSLREKLEQVMQAAVDRMGARLDRWETMALDKYRA